VNRSDPPLSPIALLEAGSALAFGTANPEEWMQPPVEATANALAREIASGPALVVLAAIAAVCHPKDYNMFPVRDTALRLKAARVPLPADEHVDGKACDEILALTAGAQLTSGSIEHEVSELLDKIDHRGGRFLLTRIGFDAAFTEDLELRELLQRQLRKKIESAPASVLWLAEVSGLDVAAKLDARVATFERASLSTLVPFCREHLTGSLVDSERTHYGIMAYRQLRGIELLYEWLPILARTLSKGAA